MKFRVFYWKSESGHKPVEEYIDNISSKYERAELFEALLRIAEYGTEAVGVRFRHIRGKLWELKISNHRIFYVIMGGEMFLLHAYHKKSQKTPIKEIETSEKRIHLLKRKE